MTCARFDLGSVRRRAAILAEMKKNAQADLRSRRSSSAKKSMPRDPGRTVASAVAGADDLADVTIGWTLDNKAGKTSLDVTLTAKPGTKTARSLAALGEAQSNFTGFLLPGAMLQANWTGQFNQSDSLEMLALVRMVRKRAMAEIEKQPYEQATIAAQGLDGLIDVVKDTLATGRVDGGVVMQFEPQSIHPRRRRIRGRWR